MNGELIPVTEAENELRQKRIALKAIEERLAQRELDLTTLQAELRIFEQRYLQVVGSRYAELEEIEAKMAGLTSQINDAQAAEWDVADEFTCGQTKFQPTERLKKLYREVARRFHPDLAAGEEERAHRHQLMIEINRAYENGASERLQALLEAESAQAELVAGFDSATELLLLTQQLARGEERVAEIDRKVAEIVNSEIYGLKKRADSAEAAGWDLLTELVTQVERQIEKSRHRLFHLEGVWQGSKQGAN